MTLSDAVVVVSGMRTEDRNAVEAVLGPIEDEAFAVDRWSTNGPAWAMDQEGIPVAIGGLSLVNGWSAVLWLVATPDCSLWRKLIRHTRSVLGKMLDPSHPIHRQRVEAYVLGGWESANRFIEALGFTHEGTKKMAGRNGEDIEIYALTRR